VIFGRVRRWFSWSVHPFASMAPLPWLWGQEWRSLFVRRSVTLYTFVCLHVCPFMCVCVCMRVSVYVYVCCLRVSVRVGLCICLRACVSVSVSGFVCLCVRLCLRVYTCVYIGKYTCMSVYLSVYIRLCFSVCVRLCACVSVSLSSSLLDYSAVRERLNVRSNSLLPSLSLPVLFFLQCFLPLPPLPTPSLVSLHPYLPTRPAHCHCPRGRGKGGPAPWPVCHGRMFYTRAKHCSEILNIRQGGQTVRLGFPPSLHSCALPSYTRLPGYLPLP